MIDLPVPKKLIWLEKLSSILLYGVMFALGTWTTLALFEKQPISYPEHVIKIKHPVVLKGEPILFDVLRCSDYEVDYLVTRTIKGTVIEKTYNMTSVTVTATKGCLRFEGVPLELPKEIDIGTYKVHYGITVQSKFRIFPFRFSISTEEFTVVATEEQRIRAEQNLLEKRPPFSPQSTPSSNLKTPSENILDKVTNLL